MSCLLLSFDPDLEALCQLPPAAPLVDLPPPQEERVFDEDALYQSAQAFAQRQPAPENAYYMAPEPLRGADIFFPDAPLPLTEALRLRENQPQGCAEDVLF